MARVTPIVLSLTEWVTIQFNSGAEYNTGAIEHLLSQPCGTAAVVFMSQPSGVQLLIRVDASLVPNPTLLAYQVTDEGVLIEYLTAMQESDTVRDSPCGLLLFGLMDVAGLLFDHPAIRRVRSYINRLNNTTPPEPADPLLN